MLAFRIDRFGVIRCPKTLLTAVEPPISPCHRIAKVWQFGANVLSCRDWNRPVPRNRPSRSRVAVLAASFELEVSFCEKTTPAQLNLWQSQQTTRIGWLSVGQTDWDDDLLPVPDGLRDSPLRRLSASAARQACPVFASDFLAAGYGFDCPPENDSRSHESGGHPNTSSPLVHAIFSQTLKNVGKSCSPDSLPIPTRAKSKSQRVLCQFSLSSHNLGQPRLIHES